MGSVRAFSVPSIGKPQPDNREAIQGGAPENCLAILNQFYNDGVNWHDVACHHKKPWVCEENESLLKYVRFTNPNIRVWTDDEGRSREQHERSQSYATIDN